MSNGLRSGQVGPNITGNAMITADQHDVIRRAQKAKQRANRKRGTVAPGGETLFGSIAQDRQSERATALLDVLMETMITPAPLLRQLFIEIVACYINQFNGQRTGPWYRRHEIARDVALTLVPAGHVRLEKFVRYTINSAWRSTAPVN